MKTKIFIIILFLLMGGTALRAQNKEADTEKAIAMLKEFYTVYDDASDGKSNIFEKYLSKELFLKVFEVSPDYEDNSLGYDPFIQAQDYEGAAINRSLKITSLGKDKYRACFLLSDWAKKVTCVDYQLKKDNQGNYMITNILSDKNFYNPKKQNKKK
ncbi:hypothetical protein [Capnocytophaga leadbetteri]|uniref:hypothetical protein n=1 Tax=Capnocytophaga leadbetteri TaxID=327575 RepID=UPI0028D1BAA9|nr:hypothetical protein [Capnocytophaga leadbetteri]